MAFLRSDVINRDLIENVLQKTEVSLRLINEIVFSWIVLKFVFTFSRIVGKPSLKAILIYRAPNV